MSKEEEINNLHIKIIREIADIKKPIDLHEVAQIVIGAGYRRAQPDEEKKERENIDNTNSGGLKNKEQLVPLDEERLSIEFSKLPNYEDSEVFESVMWPMILDAAKSSNKDFFIEAFKFSVKKTHKECIECLMAKFAAPPIKGTGNGPGGDGKCQICGKQLPETHSFSICPTNTCNPPARELDEKKTEIVAMNAMNAEQIRNGVTLPLHQFSIFCSCGRCHTATIISEAIKKSYDNGELFK